MGAENALSCFPACAGKPKHPAAMAKAQQQLMKDLTTQLTLEDAPATLLPISAADEGWATAVSHAGTETLLGFAHCNSLLLLSALRLARFRHVDEPQEAVNCGPALAAGAS